MSITSSAQEKKPEAQAAHLQQKSAEPDREATEPHERGSEQESKHAAANKPVPPETTSVAHHDLSLNSQTIHYAATADNLTIKDK